MTVERLTLVESVNSATATGKRWRARIIESDRWGSSAYYPREVLERDGPLVFTAGLQMYADHPGEAESWDRPERSIKDLVGKLVSDAVFEEDGLYADVEFHDSFVERINELHEDVGLSVRAHGLTEEAEMMGRYGPVLTALLSADSVDVVTKAGAGGKLTSILESERELAGRPVETKEGSSSMTDVTKEDFEQFRSELIEAINAIPATLAEALKPAESEGATVVESEAEAEAEAEAVVEESAEVEIDHAAVLSAVAESELPAATIPAIVADLKAGKDLSEAIKAQTDLREAFVATQTHVGTVIRESGSGESGLARAVKVLNK